MTITDAELTALLDHPTRQNPTHKQELTRARLQVILLLLADAGLRAGELVALVNGDVYFGTAVVDSLIVRAETTKTGTARTIPLSPRLRRALSDYNAVHQLPLFTAPELPLIHGPNSARAITTRQLQRTLAAASLATIGRPIHPHILRHTFATRLIRQTNARVVQELLGHKRLESTQIYTHPSLQDAKNAINALDPKGPTP